MRQSATRTMRGPLRSTVFATAFVAVAAAEHAGQVKDEDSSVDHSLPLMEEYNGLARMDGIKEVFADEQAPALVEAISKKEKGAEVEQYVTIVNQMTQLVTSEVHSEADGSANTLNPVGEQVTGLQFDGHEVESVTQHATTWEEALATLEAGDEDYEGYDTDFATVLKHVKDNMRHRKMVMPVMNHKQTRKLSQVCCLLRMQRLLLLIDPFIKLLEGVWTVSC